MIRIGMSIQHIDPEADWFAVIDDIIGDEVLVTMHSTIGQWNVTWDLPAVITNFKHGNYVEVGNDIS